MSKRRRRVRSREDFFESGTEEEEDEEAVGNRFPGPAGRIPSRARPEEAVEILRRALEEDEVHESVDDTAYDLETLSKEPWRKLVSLLDLDSSLLAAANIAWVEQVYPKLPENEKIIPFLAAVIEGEPIRGKLGEPLMTVKVMDATGSFAVSIDPKIVEIFSPSLKRGSALAMSNVNVLHVGDERIIILPLKRLICLTSETEDEGIIVAVNEPFDKTGLVDKINKLTSLQ